MDGLNARHTYTQRFLCILFVAHCLHVSVFAGERTLKERFLAEAPKGLARLKELTRHLSGTAVRSELTLNDGTGQHWRVTNRWKFKVNGALFRSEEQRFHPQLGFVEEVAAVLNAKYSFFLARKKLDGDWLVTDEHIGGANQSANIATAAKGGVFVYLPAAWSVINISLLDLIKDPAFAIKSATSFEFKGRSCIAIDFGYENQGDPNTTDPSKRSILSVMQGGRFVVDPERSWSIQQLELRGLEGISAKSMIVYSGEQDGLPVISSLLTDLMKPKAGVVTQTKVEFRDFVFGVVPENEFTLSSYGLPEPQGINWGQPPRWHLWLIGIAVSLLFLVLIFRRIQNQLARTNSQS